MGMSGKQVAAIAAVAIAIMATILWIVNGWNPTHGFMYLIAAALLPCCPAQSAHGLQNRATSIDPLATRN